VAGCESLSRFFWTGIPGPRPGSPLVLLRALTHITRTYSVVGAYQPRSPAPLQHTPVLSARGSLVLSQICVMRFGAGEQDGEDSCSWLLVLPKGSQCSLSTRTVGKRFQGRIDGGWPIVTTLMVSVWSSSACCKCPESRTDGLTLGAWLVHARSTTISPATDLSNPRF
jgi:hypothetical protein